MMECAVSRMVQVLGFTLTVFRMAESCEQSDSRRVLLQHV
jgi:hypothetical protein